MSHFRMQALVIGLVFLNNAAAFHPSNIRAVFLPSMSTPPLSPVSLPAGKDAHSHLPRAAVLRGAVSIAVGVAAAVPVTAIPLPAVMQQNAPPPVQGVSAPEQIALAQHLKAIGAKFYGAYWCPFCTLQRQMFGANAAQELPYIECAEDGFQNAAGSCRSQKEINGYPSWQINGRYYGGLKTLSDLQVLSGFDSSVKFAEYVPPGKPKPPPGGFKPPSVEAASSPAQVALAKHLKATGAKFYGAHWCRYCNKQRQLFGAEATALLPYVECAPDGFQADKEGRCDAINGYPTWEIRGKFYGGYKSVDELAELSSFTPSGGGGGGGVDAGGDFGIQGLGGPVGKSDEDCTLSGGKEECKK